LKGMEVKKLVFTSPATFCEKSFSLLIGDKGEEETVPLGDISSWLCEKKGPGHELLIALCDGSQLAIKGLQEKKARAYGDLLDAARAKIAHFLDGPLSLTQVHGRFNELFPASGECDDPEVLLAFLVSHGSHMRASDIHLKPESASLAVYFRIDGLLCRVLDMPLSLYDRFLVFVKNSSRLMAYKKSIPQDGRISFRSGNLDLDLRVALLPTLFGERTVIRLLSSTGTILPLESLGFDESLGEAYGRLIRKPEGLVLLTGPAGSGKTTTIFSSLMELSQFYRDSVNISTIEDPIEYIVERFSQTQVNPAMGLTFASGLRTLLRQDPNIILVGEIRDEETAAIALQASLSGHLVFSTLHSTGALGVFPRLMDMRIEPYLVSSAITGVIYQRLVRCICSSCSADHDIPGELAEIFIKSGFKQTLMKAGKGCDSCNGTGYRGRTGSFELLLMTPALQELVHGKASQGELLARATEEGFKSLRHDILAKISRGITTVLELQRLSL
jgi:type IV pilus assembly protein PilB